MKLWTLFIAAVIATEGSIVSAINYDPDQKVEVIYDPAQVAEVVYDPTVLANTERISDIENVSNLDYQVTEIQKSGENTYTITADIFAGKGLLQTLEYDVACDTEWLSGAVMGVIDVVRFFDVNFDGYADVILEVAPLNESGSRYQYWSFDADKGKFSHCTQFDELGYLVASTNSPMILSTSYSDKLVPTYELYSVINGKLSHVVTLKGELYEHDGVKDVKFLEILTGIVANGERGYEVYEMQNHISAEEELSPIWAEFKKYVILAVG